MANNSGGGEEQEGAVAAAAIGSAPRRRRRSSSSSSPPKSMNALTQQDIVEWDESNNIDLRKLVAASSPSSSSRTPASRSYANLEAEEEEEIPSSTEDTSGKKKKRASSSSDYDPEKEVDRLFSRLEQEHQVEGSKSSTASPVPPPSSFFGGILKNGHKRQRRQQQQQKLQDVAVSAMTPVATSSKENSLHNNDEEGTSVSNANNNKKQRGGGRPVSRRTRRIRNPTAASAAADKRHDKEANNNYKKAPLSSIPDASDSRRSSNHQTMLEPPVQPSAVLDHGANEFEELLKEIEQQQPYYKKSTEGERPSTAPAAPAGPTSSSVINDSNINTRPSSSRHHHQTTRCSSVVPQPPSLLIPQSSEVTTDPAAACSAAAAAGSNALQLQQPTSNNNNSRSVYYKQQQQPTTTTGWLEQQPDTGKHTTAVISKNPNNAHHHRAQPNSQPQGAVANHQDPQSVLSENNTNERMPCATISSSSVINNPSTSGQMTTSTASAEEIEAPVQNNYEFDDLDLSMDDLANIDALVEQATLQSSSTASAPAALLQPAVTRPTAAAVPLHQSKAGANPLGSTTSAGNKDAVDENDDPYGGFPDLDFDALDKSIADHEAKATATSTAIINNSRSNSSRNAVPPANAIVRNPKYTHLPAQQPSAEISFLSFSRYRVVKVDYDIPTYTKTLSVAKWQPSMLGDDDGIGSNSYTRSLSKNTRTRLLHSTANIMQPARSSSWPIDGVVHLRGEWYHTEVNEMDDVHVCSLSGEYRTDASSLPLLLHSCPPPGSDKDDLVLIVHPDMLLSPTSISDTTKCTRRAILKSRLGSTGLSSKAPLFGTMRHNLFEEMIKERDFTLKSAQKHVRKIVRRNAESLVSCQISNQEAETEVMKVLPQLQAFAKKFTTLDPSPQPMNKQLPLLEPSDGQNHPPIQFIATAVDAVEDPAVSPELGLKGYIDVVVEASMSRTTLHGTARDTTLMSIELKTGHLQQTQTDHKAQLSLYTLMLQSRCGRKRTCSASASATSGEGVLLYMNNEAVRAVHVAPPLEEIKSLIGQRNVVASETLRASRPRVVLSYQNDDQGRSTTSPKINLLDEPTPAALPDVLHSSYYCKKCYLNRECMMYAGAALRPVANPVAASVANTHKDLLERFTGHISDDDYAYFQKWDRLIDLEADTEHSSTAENWLVTSIEREKSTLKCISHLCFDPANSSSDAPSDDTAAATLCFVRSTTSPLQTPLQNLAFERGGHVIVSTDSTTVSNEVNTNRRPQMNIVRGFMERASDSKVIVRATANDLTRIQKIVSRSSGGQQPLLFRLDRDELFAGEGTLRQNMINLFTRDVQGLTQNPNRLAWLRDVIIRLRTPTFDNSFPMFTPAVYLSTSMPGCDLEDLAFEFSDLNDDQRAAAKKVITAKDYALIQGLPGTGKTSTIAFVARLLAAHGKRVLITSYTNAAVDNVLLKLIDKGVAATDASRPTPALIRVESGSSKSHAGVRPFSATIAAKTLERNIAEELNERSDTLRSEVQEMPSADSLRRVVSGARIVGASALTVPKSSLLRGESFDVVIVDEAGQITQPAAIGALMAADSFVLLGDHMQLPPLVKSKIAEKGGYGVSLLKHLAEGHPESVAKLTFQYRMNAEICQLSNDIMYGGLLKCANDFVSKRKLDLPGHPENVHASTPTTASSDAWLLQATDPCNPVIFVNTDLKEPVSNSADNEQAFPSLERRLGGGQGSSGSSIVNDTEAAIVRLVVGSLLSCGMSALGVGVISPLRAQVSLIDSCSSIKNWKSDGLEVSTIDKYQGRDKDVIIVSFVSSNSRGKLGKLIKDVRRLNVAVTRSKCKLIMIGSFSTLHSGSQAMRTSLNRLASEGDVLQVPKNASVRSQLQF